MEATPHSKYRYT